MGNYSGKPAAPNEEVGMIPADEKPINLEAESRGLIPIRLVSGFDYTEIFRGPTTG